MPARLVVTVDHEACPDAVALDRASRKPIVTTSVNCSQVRIQVLEISRLQ
jgi:hypothetical protein